MVIQTVLGRIEPDQLGHCQCHEHLFIAKGRSFEINPALCMDDEEKSGIELSRYGRNGGSLIVDAQPGGCGRMSEALVQASLKSEVFIIASTGFHKLMFYPENHWIHEISTDDFKNFMVSELTEGMYLDGDIDFPIKQSKAKAGIIKMALDKEGLTGAYLKILDAGIEASRKTGIPIQCHTEKAEQGPELAAYILDKGIPKENVIIAHLDRDDSKIDSILATAALGVYLQFDTIGRYKYHDDLAEIQLMKRLITSGYGNQLLIGLDTTRTRLLSYEGEIGLDYIIKQFIPLMKSEGMMEESIQKMTVLNPRKALAIWPKEKLL